MEVRSRHSPRHAPRGLILALRIPKSRGDPRGQCDSPPRRSSQSVQQDFAAVALSVGCSRRWSPCGKLTEPELARRLAGLSAGAHPAEKKPQLVRLAQFL